jgi:hypothetical protein
LAAPILTAFPMSKRAVRCASNMVPEYPDDGATWLT